MAVTEECLLIWSSILNYVFRTSLSEAVHHRVLNSLLPWLHLASLHINMEEGKAKPSIQIAYGSRISCLLVLELCFLITGGVYLASGGRRAKHLRKIPEIVWRDSIEHLSQWKSSEWERSEASVGCFEWIMCGWPTKHMEGSFKERKAAGQSSAHVPCGSPI